MEFCCTPICKWYVSLNTGKGCPIRYSAYTDDWWIDSCCGLCCCTWTYCFCGSTIDERNEFCNTCHKSIDNCCINVFNHTFCLICTCIAQKRMHEIELAKINAPKSETMTKN